MRKIKIMFVIFILLICLSFLIFRKKDNMLGGDLKILDDEQVSDKEDILNTSKNIKEYKEKYGTKIIKEAQATKDGITLPSYSEVQDTIKQLNEKKINKFNTSKGVIKGALDALDEKL